MADDDLTANDADERAVVAAWSQSSSVWMVLLTGTAVLCLMTRNAFAAALFPVVVAARASFRAAAWIRVCDADRDRATACSRFLYASGCWQALFSGIVALGLLAAVSPAVGRQPASSHIAAGVLTVAGGAAGTSLLGLWASATSWKRRVRVWVHPRLPEFAEYEFDNLSDLVLLPSRCNFAVYVTAVSVAFPPMVAGIAWMIYRASAVPPAAEAGASIGPGLALVAVAPVLAILAVATLSPRLFAAGPQDCWSKSAENWAERGGVS